MKTMCIFLVIAIIADFTIGLSYTPRRKRQSPQDEENNLDDRYGWDRPQRPWQRPNQRPNWQQPNQGQNNWPGWDQGDERPDNQDQGSNTRRPDQNQPQPTTPASGGTTTQSAALTACIRDCPVTPEYNPVCGSNGQTYTNPGRLTCAQACGVSVSLLRQSPCPASTTTAAPSK